MAGVTNILILTVIPNSCNKACTLSYILVIFDGKETHKNHQYNSRRGDPLDSYIPYSIRQMLKNRRSVFETECQELAQEVALQCKPNRSRSAGSIGTCLNDQLISILNI